MPEVRDQIKSQTAASNAADPAAIHKRSVELATSGSTTPITHLTDGHGRPDPTRKYDAAFPGAPVLYAQRLRQEPKI